MDKVVEFVTAHWMLAGLTAAVVVGLIANEIYLALGSQAAVDPTTATRLYNQQDAVFIDIRDENAYHKRHLPGAVNIPEKHLDQRGDYLAGYAGRPAVVYADGGRSLSAILARIEAAGLTPVYQLQGGLAGWQEANLPTEGRG
jgi:rhodanese-related sulfurtransferase